MGEDLDEQPKKQSVLGRCDRCGKMIIFNKFTLCYECRQDEKKEVDLAMDYLKTHRGATLNAVADATGVDPSLVLKLIRGGRVEAKDKEMRNLQMKKQKPKQ